MSLPKRQEINAGYHTPLQIPVRWQDELSGTVPTAVKAYLDAVIKNNPLLVSDEQIEVVRAYFEYYVNAPCWGLAAGEKESRLIYARLKRDIVKAHSVFALKQWTERCLEIGMDPL